MMNEEQVPMIDIEEQAEWIQDKLLQAGIIVTVDDILKVLELELEYLILNGCASYADGEDD